MRSQAVSKAVSALHKSGKQIFVYSWFLIHRLTVEKKLVLILPTGLQYVGVCSVKQGLHRRDCGSQGIYLGRTQTSKCISFELSLDTGLIACFVNDARALEVLVGLHWVRVCARDKQMLGLQQVSTKPSRAWKCHKRSLHFSGCAAVLRHFGSKFCQKLKKRLLGYWFLCCDAREGKKQRTTPSCTENPFFGPVA